jgi:hypothetical protein
MKPHQTIKTIIIPYFKCTVELFSKYTPPITYFWTGLLILDHSYLVGNLTNSKIAEKSFRTSKILTLLYQQFSNLLISQRDMSGPRLGTLSNIRWLRGITKTSDIKIPKREVIYIIVIIYSLSFLNLYLGFIINNNISIWSLFIIVYHHIYLVHHLSNDAMLIHM